jgi:endonuclease YncB( thermonuclease family)
MERIGFRGMGEQAGFASKRRRKGLHGWLGFIGLWAAAAVAGTAYGAGWLDGLWQRHSMTHAEGGGVRANFSMCFIGGGYNCVVDGDTIWLEGHKIRIADIDAPETHDPRCQSEKELGDRATLRLQQLLDGGTVTLQPIDRDRDVYGRELRLVLVDGRSVGDTLVSEGLARWYAGGRRPWC